MEQSGGRERGQGDRFHLNLVARLNKIGTGGSAPGNCGLIAADSLAVNSEAKNPHRAYAD